MSPSNSTRKAIRRLACLTIVAALLPLGLTAPAHAAPSKSPPAALPDVGQRYDLEAHSTGLRFACDEEAFNSDPVRGTLSVAVEADEADPKQRSVEAKPSGLRLTTKAAQTHTLTVDQNDVAVTERSKLTLLRPDPVKYRHVMALSLTFTVTMESPTEPERTHTLTTDEPVLLRTTLTAFPPKNDTYRLVAPVALSATTPIEARQVSLTGFELVVNRA